MKNKVYIGSIAFKTNEDELEQFLQQAGTVTSVKIIMDRETGRSKGFGFAEFETDADADQAIKTLNGQELNGRALMISLARPKAS